jgi:ABC-type Fe3+/spermidine/putrescine transport system ATPase subunit
MAQHSMLVVEDLHMSYKTAAGLVRAVRGVSCTIQPGEFYTLLGASGCGKTTILRCVAGLEAPERGRIVIDDQVVYTAVPSALPSHPIAATLGWCSSHMPSGRT